jgi:putative tricarboxylic transport membrane protein
MSDRIFGVICLVLAAFYVVSASRIELPFLVDPVGPRVFPYIIAGVLVAGALVPVLRPDPEPTWPDLRGVLEIVFAVAVMVAYAMLLRPAGFVLSTAVASALLSWRLGATPVQSLVSGIGLGVGCYLVFHTILGLSLARGPWGF